MKLLLERLYSQQILDRATAYDTLKRIGTEPVSEAEIAAVLSAINMRPAALPEIEGFRDAMLELARPVDLQGRETVDIVGTGGDGKNTFNISTLSSVVVAGAGYPVTKHGSYGVSSSVGSSDVLIALGYEFTDDQDEILRRLDRSGIVFLHAPLFHPAMKAGVPVRRSLRVRTFFNLLGPLINPARPRYQLFGTFNREVQRIYDYILQPEADREYTILHALDGYDEVSLTGPVSVRSRRHQRLLRPEDFGLPAVEPRELYGGETAGEGKAIFLGVLNGAGTQGQVAAVCANAALAIQTFHPEKLLQDCVAEARASIESGRALRTLQKMIP